MMKYFIEEIIHNFDSNWIRNTYHGFHSWKQMNAVTQCMKLRNECDEADGKINIYTHMLRKPNHLTLSETFSSHILRFIILFQSKILHCMNRNYQQENGKTSNPTTRWIWLVQNDSLDLWTSSWLHNEFIGHGPQKTFQILVNTWYSACVVEFASSYLRAISPNICLHLVNHYYTSSLNDARFTLVRACILDLLFLFFLTVCYTFTASSAS